MNEWLLRLSVTVFCGCLGWQIARRLRFPAAAMIGSLIGSGVFQVLSGQAWMPSWVKIITQSCAGMFIGLQLRRKDLKTILTMAGPVAVLLGLYTVNTLICGWIIHMLSGIDRMSAWLACVSGGLTDISLIAMDLNAEIAAVVFLQSTRLIFTMLFFPSWIRWLCRGEPSVPSAGIPAVTTETGQGDSVLIPLAALAGGATGSLLDLPAGIIIFSMVVTSVVINCVPCRPVRKEIRTVAQVLSGSLIGSTITMAMVLQLKELLIPIVVLMSGYLFVNTLYSRICVRRQWLDRSTAMFCSCPAGVSDMVLLAGDFSADMKKTGIIHLTRLVYSTALMPGLIVLINSLF